MVLKIIHELKYNTSLKVVMNSAKVCGRNYLSPIAPVTVSYI